MKKTVLIGASDNPERYSYQALKRLVLAGHDVIAISNKKSEVDGIIFHQDKPMIKDVDTVTLYLNPKHQQNYYDYILALQPRRVIFNPGTENPEFYALLRDKNIQVEIACTLVMLSANTY